ncbi:carboxypeptidase-like regulatory domain-containing protein [Mucilaginibacter sp. UR6-11]|uniref:carboxypeptidase-like regulatory domain-containing protein n=1 Tax=Mucilaginibacter sp. UR6-11 TaxID=1435644 RepID=UPI001E57F65D|nr:carboxypeptidase-like regulatory domain-containing protein [Mucilaginibacter sp. UR6-11]MCC8423336.1 carboxypeptidase-like regulatory domain-containing protein [Mucilaginibacter sp. UR6-11]
MKLFRILMLILLPIIVRAQSQVVTGKISAADTKAPIAGASVFLSNSSFGTSTGKDGTFKLNGLKPGQYNLVVSTIGYEDYTRILVVNDAPVNLDIGLTPKVTQLKEVTISTISKADKKKALEQFKQDFIGTDVNAGDCNIVNPEVLNFTYSQNKSVLEAYTDEFLIVENEALGYRIKFLLKNFKSQLLTGNVAYSGSQVFEEMKGGGSKQKKWHQKRDEAYFGSAMHFYRSLYRDSLDDAGFKIYRLSRQFNTRRPSDDEIQQHLDIAKKLSADSLVYWMQAGHFSRYSNQKFKGKFAAKDIVQKTARPGLLAISFPDHLYVVYTKKWETNYYKDVYRIPHDLNYATTIVSLVNDNQPIIIDSNGTIIANSPLYEGTWSQARLSVLLPVDYTPYGKQP